jgi:hypothetical protein
MCIKPAIVVSSSSIKLCMYVCLDFVVVVVVVVQQQPLSSFRLIVVGSNATAIICSVWKLEDQAAADRKEKFSSQELNSLLVVINHNRKWRIAIGPNMEILFSYSKR